MTLTPTTSRSGSGGGGSSSVVASGTATADVNITATTEATATTLVTAGGFTADGATTYWVFFYCVLLTPGTSPTKFWLYEAAASVGQCGLYFPTTGDIEGYSLVVPVLPAAGTRTYSMRASVAGGTAVAGAGAGGTGVVMPMSIHIRS